jgi:methionyl-tRNA formyltransferase
MKPSRILVLGDLEVATRVVDWLSASAMAGTRIDFATHQRPEVDLALPTSTDLYFHGDVSRSRSEDLAESIGEPDAFLITCYWPWILPSSVLERFSGRTVNFHPALLPFDRGWYPHVHQIREGRPGGVTLHQLAEGADTGPIWAQRQVDLEFPCTSGDARHLLQDCIFELFKETWWSIAHGALTPTPQSGLGSYHAKGEVEPLDHLDLDEVQTADTFLRALASRNTGSRSFISVRGQDGGQVFVHLAFSDSGVLKSFTD